MILQVTDKKHSTTIVNVMTCEVDSNSSAINIWDYADNRAVVQLGSASDVERCVRNLYGSGKAQVEGSIDWE